MANSSLDHKIVFTLTQAGPRPSPIPNIFFLQSKRSQEVLLLKSTVGGHFPTVNTQENVLKPQNMQLAKLEMYIIYVVIYYTHYQLKYLAITKQKGVSHRGRTSSTTLN